MTLRMHQPAPALDLPLAGGGRFTLGDPPPQAFTLIAFYRGLHCQRCKANLGEMETLLPKLDSLGVTFVAISSDSQARAEQSKAEWKLPTMKIGYGLDVEEGRKWGLFVSRGKREDEPAIFIEPALFLVDRQGQLIFAVINSITRMRPYPEDIVATIERVMENPDLARGDA